MKENKKIIEEKSRGSIFELAAFYFGKEKNLFVDAGKKFFEWVATHPKRFAEEVIAVLVIFSIVFSFYFGNVFRSEGASYTFSQTSWSGGATASNASHAGGNQTGWNEYSSKDSGISVDNSGADLGLTVQTGTADIDFGTEGSYTQEDATNGTDFGSGAVSLAASQSQVQTDLGAANNTNNTFVYSDWRYLGNKIQFAESEVGKQVTSIGLYINSITTQGNWAGYIYSGDASVGQSSISGGTLLAQTSTASSASANSYNSLNLTSPWTIPDTGEYWVIFYAMSGGLSAQWGQGDTIPSTYDGKITVGGSNRPNVIKMKVSYESSSYPTSQPYYVTTANASQINTSTYGHITGVTLTQTTPANTSLKYLVSFDGRTTWKYWNGSSWQSSTLDNLQTNGMEKATVEGLSQANWEASGGFTPGSGTLDFAVDLSTSSAAATPSVDNIAVGYSYYTPPSTGTGNIDFGTEGNYTQEDATNGTDFGGGAVSLHTTATYTADLVPQMTNYTTPSGTASASAESNVWYAWKAFDNSTSGNDVWGIESASSGWLAYDFGSSKIITKYTLTAEANGGATNSPKNWTFEGWNGSTWITLDTQTNVSFTPLQTRSYTFSNSAGYNKYRINVTANNGASYLFIADMEMMESNGYPTSQPYYVTTANASQINTSTYGHITGVTLTQTTPANTSLKYLVSFDGRTTWKYWNGSSWQSSTLDNLQTNGMEKATVEGLSQANWEASGGFTPGSGTLDFAVDLSTSSAAATPSVDNIAVGYENLPSSLTSSSYNSGNSSNTMAKIQWTENLPTGTDVKFQIRTAGDNSGTPGTWSSWSGPDGTSGTYFTDPTGGESMPSAFTDKSNDQWFQYKAFLSTSSSTVKPTLSDITVTYVVNAPPEVQNVTASQGSDGKVNISYEVRDADTTSAGNLNPGKITPSFQYWNGSTWVDATTFEAGDLTDKDVEEVGFNTYTATWNAKTDFDGQFMNGTARIRVIADDGEAANNTDSADSATFTLDTTDPTSASVLVNSSVSPAQLTISATDDSSLQMKVSLNSDLSGASWEAYDTSKTISLATDPDTVYVQFKDAYGNTSGTISTTTPETPTGAMIQDTSNTSISPAEYRLFLAWKVAANPGPGFGSYKVYRSTDQSNWNLITTINDRTVNYYTDATVSAETNYYYKIRTLDANGNSSAYSSVINGNADGTQNAGEGGGGGDSAPVISNVSISNITSSSATVNWTTDIISSSTVGYSTSASNFDDEVGTASMVTSHSVTLSGLTGNTAYYVKVKSTSAGGVTGSDSDGGAGYTFTTSAADTTDPVISSITESSIGARSLTISWSTDENSDSFVEYSTTNGFTTGATYGDYTLTTSHSVTFPTILIPNTTYYYKVHSTDASGNEAESAQRSFTTSTEGDVTAPSISGISSGTPDYNTATISWTTNENSDSYVEYGTTESYGKTFGVYNSVTSHSVDLPADLSPSTLYHFRVHSTDASGNEAVSSDNTFTTAADPGDYVAPLIFDDSIGDPSTTSVTISWSTDEASSSYIGYSQDNSYSSEQGSPELSTSHSVTLVGLNPNTIYYFRIKSSDSSGNQATDDNSGNGYTFTTDAGPNPPVINVAPSAGSITSSGVVVSWSTDISSNSFVEYGLTNGYGQAAGKYNSVTSHSVTLSGLSANTTYHFRVRSAEEEEVVSGDYTFTTGAASDSTAPEISGISVGSITGTGATITWNTDENSDSVINYGTSSSYTNLAGDSSDSDTSHSVSVSGLSYGTTYHYRIVSADSSGNRSVSSDQTFATLADAAGPVISDVSVDLVTDEKAVITWKTNETAYSRVNYGVTDDLGSSNSQISSLKTDHMIMLTDLDPDTQYYFRVVSQDAASNSTTGSETNFTTLKSPEYQHDPLSSISDIPNTPSFVTDKKAVITFDTDQPALCAVEFGTESVNYTEVPVSESNYNKEHSIHLSGLVFSTTYYYAVTCEDNLDNAISSDEYSFTTLETQVGQNESGESDTTEPEISNVDVSDVTGEKVTITWDTDEDSNSSVAYSTVSGSYENLAGNYEVNSDSSNFSETHSVTINNLIPATKYYFVVISSDISGNIAKSTEDNFTTKAPTSLSSVKAVSKNINEAVISWETDTSTSSVVEYGLTTSYGEVKSNSNKTKVHQVTISNLKSGETYHFRVKGVDSDKNLYSSSDYTFEPKSPPSISRVRVEDETEHSAIVRFSTNVRTDAIISYASVSGGSDSRVQGTSEMMTDHKVELKNLLSGVTYTTKIKVRDQEGNESEEDGPRFTTGKDEKPPKIDQVRTDSALTQNSKVQTIIYWTTDELATTELVYRESNSQEKKKVQVSNNLTNSHVAVVTSFKPGTVYYFQAKSTDSAGNESTSNEFALLTPRRSENVIQVIVNNFQTIFGWVKATK